MTLLGYTFTAADWWTIGAIVFFATLYAYFLWFDPGAYDEEDDE